MVNINDTYSGYLKAEDLNGQPMLGTIRAVEIKAFETGEKKACVLFNEAERGVLLNVTNKNILVEMFGAETDYWIGQQVEVFPSTTDFQGKMVACIRLRRPTVQIQPAQQPAMQQQAPLNPNQQQPGPAQTAGAPAQPYSETNPPPHPGTNPATSGQ